MQRVLCVLAFAALVAVSSAYVIANDMGLVGANPGYTYLGGGTVPQYSSIPAFSNFGLAGRAFGFPAYSGFNNIAAPYVAPYTAPAHFSNFGLAGRSAFGFTGYNGLNTYAPYTSTFAGYSSPIVSYSSPFYGYFKK